MCKCIIKQLLNSIAHDIMNYQNLVSVLAASVTNNRAGPVVMSICGIYVYLFELVLFFTSV